MREFTKNEIISTFLNLGEDRLYKDLLVQSVNRIILFMENPESQQAPPDKELLFLYESFLSLYRKDGEDHYLKISSVIRRAAHKIHRLLLKKHLVKNDENFLSLV